MESIRDLIDAGGIASVYQPIVNLQSGEVLAFEALARGPAGSLYQRPDVMFAEARREGALPELEWECRASAIRGAMELSMAHPAALFINVEPDALEDPVPAQHAELVAEGAQTMRLVAEITERAIASRPAALLRAMQGIRELGAGVAVDDVGADDRSLAILPFLRPDVVKLDLRLIQERTNSDIASVYHAVSAHTERTGARVLAEGIETDEHLRTAIALGATLGQGWYFGRPGPLPRPLPVVPPWGGLALLGTSMPIHESHTPFEILHGSRDVVVGDERILLSISRHLEDRAIRLGARGIILGALQDARHATPRTRDRYRRLASAGVMAGLLGAGMSSVEIEGVARGELGPNDRLRREWSVTVLGPHFAAGLAAHELESGPPRRFALTHNRELVVRMAASLLFRLERGAEM